MFLTILYVVMLALVYYRFSFVNRSLGVYKTIASNLLVSHLEIAQSILKAIHCESAYIFLPAGTDLSQAKDAIADCAGKKYRYQVLSDGTVFISSTTLERSLTSGSELKKLAEELPACHGYMVVTDGAAAKLLAKPNATVCRCFDK